MDARKVIVGSSASSALLYILLGTLGAMSRPKVSNNLLTTLMSGDEGSLMQVTAFIFCIFIVGLGIPLLSVLGRLNLTGSGYSKLTGDICAVYLPFGFSWLFYRGELVTELLSWGGILFTSMVGFLFPILLSIKALDVSKTAVGSIFGFQQPHEERRALQWLLGLAIVAVLASILGNLVL